MGQYLEITSGPSVVPEAEAGDLVIIYLGIRNKHTAAVQTRLVATNDIYAETNAVWLNPGDWSWNVRFTMPNHSVSGVVELQYWGTDDRWHTQDTGPFSAALVGEAPPTDKATIETIRVNGAPYPLSLSTGDEFRVTFNAKNLQASGDIRFEASVKIKDPDGYTEYSDSHTDPAYPWTPPGGYYGFEFPMKLPLFQSPVLIDKPGEWTIDIYLYDHGTGELLDQETGVVIVEAEGVPGEVYEGEIRNPKIRECNGLWKNLSDSPELPTGKNIEMFFEGWNTGSCKVKLWGYVEVTSPSGGTFFEEYDDSELGYNPNSEHDFKFPWGLGVCTPESLHEVGEYTVSFRLEVEHEGQREEVDSKEYTFSVLETAPPDGEPSGKAEIVHKALDFELIGSGYPIPVTETISVPEHARLSIIAKTISDERERLKAEVWIYGPGEAQKEHFADMSSWPCCDPQTQHEFIFPTFPGTFTIDEEGDWTIKILITDATDDELLAKYEGALFSAEEAAPSPWTAIIDMMPLVMIMMMFGMMIPMMQDMGKMFEEEVVTYRVEEAPSVVPPERRLPPGR